MQLCVPPGAAAWLHRRGADCCCIALGAPRLFLPAGIAMRRFQEVVDLLAVPTQYCTNLMQRAALWRSGSPQASRCSQPKQGSSCLRQGLQVEQAHQPCGAPPSVRRDCASSKPPPAAPAGALPSMLLSAASQGGQKHHQVL